MLCIKRKSLVLLILFVGFASSAFGDDDPPNIILVMADDLGWGDVAYNQNKTVQTPHLDAFARFCENRKAFQILGDDDWPQQPDAPRAFRSTAATDARCDSLRNHHRIDVVRR